MRSLGKTFRDLRFSIFYGALMTRRVPLMALGNESTGCQWTFTPRTLLKSSLVYSGGVGNDISFEHGLVDRFGCEVYLFDPSPTGAATMRREENQVPNFRFRAIGIDRVPGTLKLSAPLNPEEGSWFSGSATGTTIEVPCLDLASIMRENGHEKIDLLKLDIEGPEYGVIEQIVREQLHVRQICVEYHHGILPGYERRQTISSILMLIRRGYKLIHQVGNNHTFYMPD